MTGPTKDEVAAMVADREAGTPGDWACHFGDDQTTCNCKYILAEYGGMGSIATIDVCEKMDGEWGDDTGPPEGEAQANARRIARVPQIEQWVIDLTTQLAASEAARVAAEARAEDAELIAASLALKEIVEGVSGAMDHGTFRAEKGMRLKDTPEWVAFYVALAQIGAKP